MKELVLAAAIQGALERVYRIDRRADVGEFLAEGDREMLLVREAEDGAVEMRLCLPAIVEGCATLDAVCQVIEGVSHFVYVAERAAAGRAATQLELELQAEVDKWVVLAASEIALSVERSAELRERLYERVSFTHDETSEAGERYRVANDAANRFVRKLERAYVSLARFGELRDELRRFHRAGQEEKLRLGRAA